MSPFMALSDKQLFDGHDIEIWSGGGAVSGPDSAILRWLGVSTDRAKCGVLS
jgi:hypothetical protein